MDALTLAIAYIGVACTIAIASFIISIHRQETSFRWYSLGFVSSALGTLLLALVGENEPFSGLILANTLTQGTFIFMLIGIKAHFHQRLLWSKRNTYTLLIFVVTFSVFALIVPSFMIRSILYSIYLAIMLIEMFSFLTTQLDNTSPLIRTTFFILVGGYLATILVRLTLVIVQSVLHQIDFYEDSVTSLVLIVSIAFAILWLTATQLLGSDTMLERLTAKEQEITKLVQTDQLTGLWNRSYFEEQLPTLVDAALSNDEELCLIHFDVDHFKDLNERFGHAIGDQVIKEIVTIVRQTLSPSTPVIRWGGQEFMILSHSGLDDSFKKAEVLRHNIANNNFTHFESVTASFGVAAYRDNEASDLWFKRTELALRSAKQEGRNCVITSK